MYRACEKQTDLLKSQYPRVMLTHQINKMEYQIINASFYQRENQQSRRAEKQCTMKC